MNCDQCIPRPWPENEEAIAVYNLCANQIISVGMGSAVDINFQSIEIAMNRLNIKDKDECFNKVVACARSEMSKKNAKE